MRPWFDKAIAAGTVLLLAAFFGAGLLYPLCLSLAGGFRETLTLQSQQGENWAQIAERSGVSETSLRALNGVPKDEAAPKAPRNVVVGQGWTFRHVTRIFDGSTPQNRALLNSLLLAAAVTALCAAVSYPLAWLHARMTFRYQALLAGMLLLPLVMPPFVGAIGLRRMLAKYGSLNLLLQTMGLVDPATPIDFLDRFRLLGCALVMVLHFYPLLYLNLVAAMSAIDPALLESSRSLGYSPWQTFRRVVFPLSLPGLVAGGSLVFTGAFMDLGTPLIFGYQETVAKQIFSLANEQHSNPLAPALVAVSTVLVLGIFITARWAAARYGATLGGVKGQSRTVPRELTGGGLYGAYALHAVVIGLAVLPHIAVFLGAFGDKWFTTVLPPALTTRHLQEALSDPLAAIGMRNSLLYAAVSTALDVLLGLLCAWAIVRAGGWWGRAMDLLTVAPLAIPGLVLAFGYVGAYAGIYLNENSYMSQIARTFAMPGVGLFLILSYAVRRLPYTVRSCVAGLEQTPRALEEAANGLGYPPGQVALKVTLPLIMANVIAGAILAFSFAMLEVSDSLVLANTPESFPLTKSIYMLFGNPGNGDQLASALGLVALVFLGFSLLAAASVMGRKFGQMFKG